MIKCICKTCKKEFYKFPSAIQHGEGKFCSQKCNIQNDLIAHHVKGWTKYPKLRYIISNGLTVCHNCHWDIHRTMTTVPS